MAFEYPTPDPLHEPDQFAALLDVMGFILSGPELAELMAHYPQFPHRDREKGVQ